MDYRIKRNLVSACLEMIDTMFTKEKLSGTGASEELIFAALAEITNAHCEFEQDAEFMVHLVVDNYLSPLKSLMPQAVNLAPIFVVFCKNNKFHYELKMVNSYEMNELIWAGKTDMDPRISVIENWGLLVRMDWTPRLLPKPRN